jgi:hypothetical protein
MVVALKMIFFVVLVVVVRIEASRLCHYTHIEPENSCIDQYHARDICKLTSSAVEQAHDRSHHPPGSLRIHIHPRRIPHERLDRSKNFAVLLHNVAPTKNFYYDSHWQQSHSIRWSYIWARMLAVIRSPQNWHVVNGGVVKVLVVAQIRMLLPMAIQLEKEWR